MATAALITWIITAGFGFFMLSTWLSHGGARAGSGAGNAGAATHFPPAAVFAHALLAAAGLVVWIIYLLGNSRTLAWVAFADLVVVAGIGDVLVLRWRKDRVGAPPAAGVRTGRRGAEGSADSTSRGTSGVALAEQRIPTAAVVAHGIFAVTTVVLVLVTALRAGSG
ncbi:MAG TPA: hypothetical protein VFJ94_10500 [Intrasporangium sp.]|uniref:hypothetical protein n=1 Tax=Intrasporangium sp. TaxID=1925024 RepID=UPI002D7A2A17|nr:hypothetical protein [Intrasporangium sp.]HET7398940.1 hypothetical protein [Intrasporangium sp.]